MEDDLRTTVAAFGGLLFLTGVSAQVPPGIGNNENWRPLGVTMSFGLGDQVCGAGRHQSLRRDWRGDWWWGPCVADK